LEAPKLSVYWSNFGLMTPVVQSMSLLSPPAAGNVDKLGKIAANVLAKVD
jgi:hypothetical protein